MESKVNKYSSQLIIINSVFIILWLTISIFPFLWTLWGSFKVKADFFSRSDWWYAISGFNTMIETGGSFTLNGYIESWIEGAFWKAARISAQLSPAKPDRATGRAPILSITMPTKGAVMTPVPVLKSRAS